MRFTTGIHIIYSPDALFGPAALQVSVSSNVVKLIQAAIVSDDAAHILCAADFAGKSITCNGVLIPSLIYRSVSARNTTDILSTGNISTHSAALNGGFNSVWRTATNIHSTRNASGKFTAGDYRAVKAALADRTLPHSIVTRANDAAHIIHALDGGMADAIFNDALETTGKCTDLTLAAVITDDNTLFNGAVANGRDKGGTGSGKAVHIIIHLCADQAGFEGFGAGFQRHIFDDDRKGVAACKADTVKTIYQTVAVDLLAVDVQIFDRGVLNIGQQRPSAFGDSQ